MVGRQVTDMIITVDEFLGMAFDNLYNFSVYDFSKEKNIFESRSNKELPEKIGYMNVESWQLGNGEIILNVDSGE